MALITRTNAAGLIPEEYATEIISGVRSSSAALRLFRSVNMSRKTKQIPVLSALPTATWLTSDTDNKATSNAAWENKTLTAEELAVIVPIPEAVLDDAEYDVWGEVRPLLVEAFGVALDAAIFFGTNKPTSWPAAVSNASLAAGNAVVRGAVATQDITVDISDVMTLVEADGYDVNGFAAPRKIRGALRGLRDDNGQPILGTVDNQTMLYGEDIAYPSSAAWNDANTAAGNGADLIAGDFSQGILATRQDITYKLLTEATITDGAGAVVYSLAEQDMVALRAVARFAFQVPNPINREQGTESARYPFGILQPVGWAAA